MVWCNIRLKLAARSSSVIFSQCFFFFRPVEELFLGSLVSFEFVFLDLRDASPKVLCEAISRRLVVDSQCPISSAMTGPECRHFCDDGDARVQSPP
mmetsp:Transcript_18337/g.27218  ORF Transcript_18337/g.27218 Transcript_18337/m.27218 type:complete len:96 (+) Transcript_18337:293-580(+)